MGAALLCARADLRRRWMSVLLLALLVGIAGGAVLMAVAGARRTGSSLDRFVAQSQPGDSFVFTDLDELDVKPVERLPQVAAVAVLDPIAAEVAGSVYVPVAASVDGRYGRVMDRPRLLAGRHAPRDAVDEVAVSESTAKLLGVGVGSRLTLHTYTPEQVPLLTGQHDPAGAGPTIRLHVVGIERFPADVGRAFRQSAFLLLPPGFLRVYGDQIGRFQPLAFRARLENGRADLAGFIRAVQRIYGRDHVEFDPVSFESAGVQDQLDVLSTGLLAFAAVAALAGLVAIGQSLARRMLVGAAEHPALRALGMSRREQVAALLGPAVVVAGAGSFVALAIAVAASPLMPIGAARRAEPDLGFAVDGLVLAMGIVVLAALVAALAVTAAWRLTRRGVGAGEAGGQPRPSVAARELARAGVGPVAVTGVRMALEPGRGRTSVPVRAALIGTAVGVAGVVATLIFGASLDRLVDTPSRYGWDWDVLVNTRLPAETVRRDPAVAGVTEARYTRLEIGGHPVNAVGVHRIEGSVLPTVLRGRAPRGAGEVALGRRTLDDLDLEIGDRAHATGSEGRGALLVVGEAVFASVDDRPVLAEGAVLTEAGLSRFRVNDAQGSGGFSVYLVRFAPGADQRAARRRLTRASGDAVGGVKLPPEVDHLTQVDRLPFVLAGFLALLAVLALTHALVTSVRRRRRDLAILGALGFVRRQVEAAVASQAATVALVGLAVGVPLGVVAGRLAWGRVAGGLGVATDPAVPVLALALTIPAAVVLACLVAVLPARAAARTRPAVVLRAE